MGSPGAPAATDLLAGSHFSVNLTMLARSQPELASEMTGLAADSTSFASLGAQIETARSGALTMSYPGQGYIHSRYDPHREAAAWAAGVKLRGKVLILFGFGLGYHVEHLLQRKDVGRVIVVEPDVRRLMAAMAARNLGRILATGRVRFLHGTDYRKLVNDQSTLLLAAIREGGWSFAALPAYRRFYGPLATELERQLFLITRSMRVDIISTGMWSPIWIRNVVANLPYLSRQPNIDHWFRRWPGTPAVLVAAGPSLTANLPLLARLQGRVPIIVAGSGFNPLLDYGIEPDLIVSLDGGEYNYEHFTGREIKVPLAFGPTIHPMITANHKGPLIAMPISSEGLHAYLLEAAGLEVPLLPMGPSIANTTLALMTELGFDPVILVGQDLAFPGDEYHAEGVRGPRWTSESQRNSYIWVPDVQGGQVPTTGPFYTMLAWFENYLAHKPQLTVINTSHNGARIAGTREASLAAVIKEYDLLNREWKDGAFVPEQQEQRELDLTALLGDIVDSHLNPAVDLAEKGLHLTRRALATLAPGRNQANGSRAVAAVVEVHREMRGLHIYRKLLQPILRYRALALGAPPADKKSLLAWLRESEQFYENLLSLIAFLREVAP